MFHIYCNPDDLSEETKVAEHVVMPNRVHLILVLNDIRKFAGDGEMMVDGIWLDVGPCHGVSPPANLGSSGILGEREFRISHFRFHISHLKFSDTLLAIERYKGFLDHPPGRESDHSEVEQLVRLLNAIKSKMKIKILVKI